MTAFSRSLLLALIALGTGCGDASGPPAASGSVANAAAATESAGETAAAEQAPAAEADTLPDGKAAEMPAQVATLLKPFRGTWDELFERRAIRALVVYNRTSFFFDGPRARGIAADAFVELEKHLNSTLNVGARRIHIAAIPVARDQIIPYLAEGRGDIAVANLTITDERLEQVDFTVPTSRSIDEVIVTGPAAPQIVSLDDLAGRKVYIRRSSSFRGSLERLNESLRARGLQPAVLEPANENLETEDILEMVNAGVVPITIADSHVAAFWSDVFPDLVVHGDLKVAEGQRTAWAVRKDATGLKAVLDPWIEANRQGTLLGNTLVKRYLKANPWVKNPGAEEDRQRFRSMLGLFHTYADRFSLAPLLVVAQGYQESGLDQARRSAVGAVGVMQVMPATARDPAVGIPDIEELEPNIHAGSKYLRHLIDEYFDDPGINDENRLLFAFAGYNAGPNRINRLREVAEEEGLDPNRWFRNVELVVAREVGREPVQYVANIYKYYVAYTLIMGRADEDQAGG